MTTIWQSIRAHGFRSTGAHFLDFNDIHLEPSERLEYLYQHLISFIDDNLLIANSNIQHYGENVTTEEVTPSLDNMIVLTWLTNSYRLACLGKTMLRYRTEITNTSNPEA